MEGNECTSGKGQCWQAEKGDTITSLAKILNVSAEQLNTFLQNPQNIQIGQEFDISGFWSWRAGITPGTEPAVVFVDLVDESEIPGDKYSIDVTIGPRFPIRNLSKQAAQKLWNEKGKIARQLTKEDNRVLREFFGQGTRGKLKDLKDFKIPPGLTKQALERYAEIARRAVESGNDKSGVQRDRLELIERALKTMKD